MASADMAPDKPVWPAPERNKAPILEWLRLWLGSTTRVLEIGTGTAQHAVHFAAALPHLMWQCSDQVEYHRGITQWLHESALPNMPPVLALDVTQTCWPEPQYDAIYTANTLHIMPWAAVLTMIKRAGELLPAGGLFIAYGPFNFAGQFSSVSNANFDASLKQAAAHQGVRNFESVEDAMTTAGFSQVEFVEMPANNHMIMWKKGVGRVCP